MLTQPLPPVKPRPDFKVEFNHPLTYNRPVLSLKKVYWRIRMEGKNEKLFRSSFFRRLFLSYVLLILFSIAAFSSWYLVSDNANRITAVRNEAQQKAVASGI